MNRNIPSKSAEPPSCAFLKSHGHRCRMLPVNGTPYCLAHRPKPAALPDPRELVRAELAEAAGTLSTPAEIHRLQAQVTLLLIHGRIAPKLANSYSYQVLTLLRGCREIAHHEKLHAERAEHEAEEARRNTVLSWSIPRPDRSDPSDSPEAAPNPSSTPAAESSENTASIPAASIPSSPASCTPSEGESEPAPVGSSLSIGGPSPTPSSIPADFYNHFFPLDPSLPPGLQDRSKNIPPPDEAECRRLARRRGLDSSRRRPAHPGGYR